MRECGYFQVLIPLIGLCVNIASQIIGFKFILKNAGLLKSVYLGFAAGLISIIFLKSGAAFFLSNMVIYCALGYCYFHFINLGETARRIRILRELYSHKNGLDRGEILGLYNAKEITDNRLGRLLSSGQVVMSEDRYYIGRPIMFFIARCIYLLKAFIFPKAVV